MAGITVTDDGVIIVPKRAARRAFLPRDKAKAGRYRGYGAPSRWRGDDSVGCRENLQFAAVVDEPAPEPVEPVVVERDTYSTAVTLDAALDARNTFDVLAVERDRCRFAVGRWGIRSN